MYVRVCKLTQGHWQKSSHFARRRSPITGKYWRIWRLLSHQNNSLEISRNIRFFRWKKWRNVRCSATFGADWFWMIIIAIKRVRDKEQRKKKSRICISKQNSDVIIFYASEMRKNNKRNYLIFSSQHFIEIISSGNSSTSNVRRRSWLSPITSKARFERGNVRNNDLLMLSI